MENQQSSSIPEKTLEARKMICLDSVHEVHFLGNNLINSAK